MRRTFALLALAGLLALSAVSVAASPPGTNEKVQKAEYSKIVKSDTADTSAVAARDAEARTSGVVTGDVTPTATNAARIDYANSYRQRTRPPERLNTGTAGRRTEPPNYRPDVARRTKAVLKV